MGECITRVGEERSSCAGELKWPAAFVANFFSWEVRALFGKFDIIIITFFAYFSLFIYLFFFLLLLY
jgi:hypothetical protein